MEKCLIFNTDKDYVRTKNFIKYTKEIFEHKVINSKSRAGKIISLFKSRGCWAYVPNLDPILAVMSKIARVNLISDILEPYPEMQAGILKRAFYSLLERISIKNSHLTIAVTKEEEENLGEKYNIKNIMTVRNFPDLDDFKPCKGKFSNFSIVYFGLYALSRDLTNATKAIKELQKKYAIDFHVIGDEKLLGQTLCRYKYHGWLNHEKSSEIIGRCHLGISPYENNEHCNLTLQNKAFQYAACNVVPLSTDLKPLKKYKKIVKLADNTAEGWKKNIEKAYFSWLRGRTRFNQREELIQRKWNAENEWQKLKHFICKFTQF